LPPSSIEGAIHHDQPFITFSTAHLFNGTSLAFLQCALSPIIIELHSLSTLFDLQATFQMIELDGRTPIATFEYWREIVNHSQKVLTSLTTCVKLLPPGVFHVLTFLSRRAVDLYLVFFESFINRALDNSAVLGLLPWNPSKDIADVFRTKCLPSLKSKSLMYLQALLMQIPEYGEMNVHQPLLKIIRQSPPTTAFMLSELLSTNPSFPKELLVTGTDLVLLHEAATTVRVENAAFSSMLSSLGALPECSDRVMDQHFRIVITRQERTRQTSLFSARVDLVEQTAPADAYAGLFCDIASNFPTVESFNVSSVFEFVDRLAVAAPLFLDERIALQAEAVLWDARDCRERGVAGRPGLRRCEHP
jgi:hypothetical protein